MRSTGFFLILSLAFSLVHAQVFAQQKVLSPRDSVTLKLDTNTVSVNYGRPSMRGRKIMGDLVPLGQVWRTGANEATRFKTNFDMMLGGVPVPRGTYTMFTIPSQETWKVILNKQTGQWGTAYDEQQDYARFDVKVEQLPAPVETLTIALQAKGKTSGVMNVMWENTRVSIPFEKNDKIRPVSPLDSTAWVVGGKKVALRFSKPYNRGREIWGVVVPNDSIWRTGANSATELHTEADLMIGGANIPKGIYTLYSVPSTKSLTLIVNSKAPGDADHDANKDLARIDMKLEKPDKEIDPFSIWLEPKDNNHAVLKLGWGDRVYAVDVKTK